jgi:hypothetical protein
MLVAFKASVATGCLQTVMIEPKMLTQSVKAKVVKENKSGMTKQENLTPQFFQAAK